MNDIFEFRNGLVENYKKFSTSFASPRSTDIASKVQAAYDEGRFWPDPLIQINPNYRKGAFIDELARQGNVEPETAQIFQTGKQEEPPCHRYFEFAEDLERRAKGHPNFQYIITTTEPPPERFRKEPYLRLQLDASRPEDRFLKCNL